MRPQDDNVERILARLAHGAHGVVTRRAMEAADLTAGEIKQRVASGALIRVHRGVYRVGHAAPSVEPAYLSAVLACGDAALLSGHAAAWFCGLVRGDAPRPEVTAPSDRCVRGVLVRRSPVTCERDRWRFRGVPMTTVPRILVDLARSLPLAELAGACHEAGIKFRTTPAQVARVLQRDPKARGRANLEVVMGRRVLVTASAMERRFLCVLRADGLRLPDETNRPAGGRRVDCRWRVPPLTVELDSFTFHGSRHAWERDHRRAREAYARGDEFRRYCYADVFEDTTLMLAELRPFLAIDAR
jgi:hypothetical protein